MKKRILIAILDWGLGHASRMVPVVECLSANGANITLASSGAAGAYLQQRFPQMDYRPLPAPEVLYGQRGAAASLLLQATRQPYWNARQHSWTVQLLNKESFQGIISDNLYGVHHPDIPSVLVSHQLSLPAPLFGKWINRRLAHWLNRFDHIWVPDAEDGIAGMLSQNEHCTQPVHYLGNLSRLKPQPDVEQRYKVVALLSGPEPQRSIFEREALRYLSSSPGPHLLIRGLPKPPSALPTPAPHIEVQNFLDGEALARALQSARVVLCRSGFSTLSDLRALSPHAIVVPTPGQYEQEYLARRVEEMGWGKRVDQSALACTPSFEHVRTRPMASSSSSSCVAEAIVPSWLRGL